MMGRGLVGLDVTVSTFLFYICVCVGICACVLSSLFRSYGHVVVEEFSNILRIFAQFIYLCKFFLMSSLQLLFDNVSAVLS